MKRVAPLLAVVLLAVALLPRVRADMYTVHRQGGTIAPLKSEDVSMDAEDVSIEPHDDGYNLVATFVMRNHADRQVDSLVAFPVLGSRLGSPREFKVLIKGDGEPDSAFQEVKAEFKQGRPRKAGDESLVTDPPKTIGDYPEIVVWNVIWQPRQTKVIRVRFDMGLPTILPGTNDLAQGCQWTYIVTTGNLWKGPIGRADITFRFPGRGHVGWPAFGAVPRVSYPSHAKWKDYESVAWQFENWTPTSEIWVRSADWQGLPIEKVFQYAFSLPRDYLGAREEYSETAIEELVTRDLRFATEYFPQEARTFDRNLLRIATADWLLHEIYARHGDPFSLGKESPTFPQQDHMIRDGEGNLYSWWNHLFRGYSYKGGWYRPNSPPAGAVKTAALHPIEQKNVTFLRAYLDKLRSDPKYQALRDSAHTPGIE